MKRYLEEAYRSLYPQSTTAYEFTLKYSGQFSDYNANIRHSTGRIEARISKEWRGVSKEIQIGLFHSLLAKLFKTKRRTEEMDLYDSFMKRVHIAAPKDRFDPLLAEHFQDINDAFFHGMMDMPNLIWGTHSMRKLGSYEYGNDTIMLSTVLKEAPIELLRFVLYHEMLHKKLKYYSKNGRSYYHTPEFKRQESLFPNAQQLEKNLQTFLRKKKRSTWLEWF